jgi:hypothetical protein
MKKIIIILAVSFFAVSAYAQNSTQNEYEEWKPSPDEYADFDIGKYFTPDIVRNQLDINFDFRSGNSRFDDSNPERDRKQEYFSIASNVSSSFLHYVNTRKKISTLSGNLSFKGNNYSQKSKQTFTTGTDNESSSFQQYSQNSLSLSWLNKWYFSNLIFMDYGIGSGMSYNFRQNKTKNQTDDTNQKRKEFHLNISPQIGIGYGRIENVRDARQAVYIANALSKKGVLTRNLSDDELFELSQIISTVKNKRFLDSRLHLIEEITTLDSFFEDNDLLADNGAAYFTTLHDMWQYGGLFSRHSGYEISFVARPAYHYRNAKYTPEMQDIIYNSNHHLISLIFSYEKPFKFNWQHSFAASVFGGVGSSSEQNKQTDNDYKNTTKDKSLSASADYSLGYYPNTRTNIRVTASQQISKDFRHLRTNVYDDERSTMNYYSALRAGLYYYFSPNLRLAGDCGFWYAPRRTKGNEGFYSNRNVFESLFNIQLTYLIF